MLETAVMHAHMSVHTCSVREVSDRSREEVVFTAGHIWDGEGSGARRAPSWDQ